MNEEEEEEAEAEEKVDDAPRGLSCRELGITRLITKRRPRPYLQRRDCAPEDVRWSCFCRHGNQEIPVVVEINQWSIASGVSLHPHANRLRPVVLALREHETAQVANAGFPWWL